MKKLFREILGISLYKSIRVNFGALPFKQAIKFPILVSRYVKIDGRVARDSIMLTGKISPAMILFGVGGSRNFSFFRSRRSYLKLGKHGRVVFEGTARFAQHFTLIANDATMRFGAGFSCNNGCLLFCDEGITFGENCLLGRDVEIRDSDGHTIIEYDGVIEREKANKRAVTIGNHVWLCSCVTVLKGVEIGDDCVVAHSSVCTKTYPGNRQLIAGYPAKVIRENITWRK